MNDVGRIMQLAPVIPVLVIDDIAYARPIAEALVAGGLRALEVTLRTPVALDAIREMAKVDGAIVGAGTVLNEADLEASLEAGARFIVSPGLTEPLSKAAIASRDSLLAGYRYGRRHDARAGFGPEPVQIFSGRGRGRYPRPQGARRPFPSMHFLSDRRHHAGDRARLAGARGGALRGWKLARAAGQAQS